MGVFHGHTVLPSRRFIAAGLILLALKRCHVWIIDAFTCFCYTMLSLGFDRFSLTRLACLCSLMLLESFWVQHHVLPLRGDLHHTICTNMMWRWQQSQLFPCLALPLCFYQSLHNAYTECSGHKHDQLCLWLAVQMSCSLSIWCQRRPPMACAPHMNVTHNCLVRHNLLSSNEYYTFAECWHKVRLVQSLWQSGFLSHANPNTAIHSFNLCTGQCWLRRKGCNFVKAVQGNTTEGTYSFITASSFSS